MSKLDLGVKIISEKGEARIYVTEHMQFSGGRNYDGRKKTDGQ